MSPRDDLALTTLPGCEALVNPRERRRGGGATYDELIATPGDDDAFLKYSHARLPQQLEDQGVRGLELDLFPDPQGGQYAMALARSPHRSSPAGSRSPRWPRGCPLRRSDNGGYFVIGAANGTDGDRRSPLVRGSLRMAAGPG
jgi:hypothetical protein